MQSYNFFFILANFFKKKCVKMAEKSIFLLFSTEIVRIFVEFYNF